MQILASLTVLNVLCTAIVGLIATVAAFRWRVTIRLSRPIFALAVFPPLLMLGSFYSLAIHMRFSLGAWPNSIGTSGFPSILAAHANIAMTYYAVLLLLNLFVLPVATSLCLVVSRWKHISYLALYALLFVVCWCLMQLAPEPFLYWWRD